jgi:hypothetical protein
VLRFRNGGAGPLRWSLTASARALSVQPADGSLPPGATASVTVRLDWAAVPEGAFTGWLRLAAAGQRDVPVSAVQERPPVLTGVAATSPWLVPLSSCHRTRVGVAITDESPVTVMVSWGLPGGLLHPGQPLLLTGPWSGDGWFQSPLPSTSGQVHTLRRMSDSRCISAQRSGR